MANTPIETIEADQPLLVERYGLVPDSGGPGTFRGGLGMVREFRVTAEEATFQLRSDRQNFRPWGAEGGMDGTPTENYINPGTDSEQIPAKYLTTLKKGDLYRLIQAGGGGYGDPLDRDVNAVLEDVEQEKMSVEYVRREYGVVIDPDDPEPGPPGHRRAKGPHAGRAERERRLGAIHLNHEAHTNTSLYTCRPPNSGVSRGT